MKSEEVAPQACPASAAHDVRFARPNALDAMLVQELTAPVEFELRGESAGAGGDSDPAELASIHCFRELFDRSAPPLPLLRMTKDFAKAHLLHPESTLVKEVATTLYYASIALALTRHNGRITHLSDQDLSNGLRWCLAQPWMDKQLRSIFLEAVRYLGRPSVSKAVFPTPSRPTSN